MADFRQVFSIDNDVFKAYAFYAAVLGLKMYGVTFATIYHRFSNKVFANQEDAKSHGAKVGIHPEVERARRAHLNDLENIVPFWTLGLLFVATSPSVATATMCYRIFTYSRIAHSFIYILHVPQPARALTFMAGMAVNLFMGYKIVTHFLAHQNDLENIIPFWILGLLFVAINPLVCVATWCFRIFTAARIIHSIAYVSVVPQPTRVVAFLLAAAANLFMALEIVIKCF